MALGGSFNLGVPEGAGQQLAEGVSIAAQAGPQAFQQQRQLTQQQLNAKIQPMLDIINSNLQAGRIREAQAIANAFLDTDQDLKGFKHALIGLEAPTEKGKVVTSTVSNPKTGELELVFTEVPGGVIAGQEVPQSRVSLGGASPGKPSEQQREADIALKREEAAIQRTAKQEDYLFQQQQQRASDPQMVKLDVATRGLEDAVSLMKENPTIYRKIIDRFLGKGKAAQFDTLVTDALSIEILARSGVAVNKKEFDRLKKTFTPQYFSDPETAVFKIERLKLIMDYAREANSALDPVQFRKEAIESGRLRQIQSAVDTLIDLPETPAEASKTSSDAVIIKFDRQGRRIN